MVLLDHVEQNIAVDQEHEDPSILAACHGHDLVGGEVQVGRGSAPQTLNQQLTTGFFASGGAVVSQTLPYS
jgi:hypothetical protein